MSAVVEKRKGAHRYTASCLGNETTPNCGPRQPHSFGKLASSPSTIIQQRRAPPPQICHTRASPLLGDGNIDTSMCVKTPDPTNRVGLRPHLLRRRKKRSPRRCRPPPCEGDAASTTSETSSRWTSAGLGAADPKHRPPFGANKGTRKRITGLSGGSIAGGLELLEGFRGREGTWDGEGVNCESQGTSTFKTMFFKRSVDSTTDESREYSLSCPTGSKWSLSRRRRSTPVILAERSGRGRASP